MYLYVTPRRIVRERWSARTSLLIAANKGAIQRITRLASKIRKGTEWHEPGGDGLTEVAAAGEHFVQLSARGKLQNDVDPVLVPEIAVHSEDILLPVECLANVGV
jgi:hypothetical protein